MLHKYRSVLFDIDNTIIAQSPTIVEQICDLLGDHSPSAQHAAQTAYARSELWIGEQILDENRKGYRMPDEEFKSNVLHIYQTALHLNDTEGIEKIISGQRNAKRCLTPNAKNVLDGLYKAGVLLGIVSNNGTRIRQTLNELGIDQYFAAIILSDEVGIWKPDAKIFSCALSAMQSCAEETLYVGDHPLDIFCAHEAGIDAAWYQPFKLYDTLPEYIGTPEMIIKDIELLL